MAAVGFWRDQKAAQKVVQEVKSLKNAVEPWEEAERSVVDVAELLELMAGEKDADSEAELAADVDRLEETVERLRIATLLSDSNDALNALLKVQSGTGGADCQEWTVHPGCTGMLSM